jgi:hypothetical protein
MNLIIQLIVNFPEILDGTYISYFDISIPIPIVTYGIMKVDTPNVVQEKFRFH